MFKHLLDLPGGSMVKNSSAKQETQVLSLGQEDPLEKEMATHSRVLAWEMQGTEEPNELQSMRVTKSWIWLSKYTPIKHYYMSWNVKFKKLSRTLKYKKKKIEITRKR